MHLGKNLGVALVAALALAGVAASSAFATFPFTTPEGPTALTETKHTGEGTISGSAFSTKCETEVFTGTQSAASASTLTVAPFYTNCKTNGSLSTIVTTTGFTEEFTTPTVKIEAGKYTGEPPHIR